MTKKNIILSLLVVLFIGLFLAWKPIKAIYLGGVPAHLDDPFLYVHTGADFETLVADLKKGNFIQNEDDFRWLAEYMKFDKPRAGRFEITPAWSNRELIQHLRAGKQAEVKVALVNERLPEDVAGKAARFLESDSLAFLKTLQDTSFLLEMGIRPEHLLTIFIPNTYNFFWNTSPQDFVKRMVKLRDEFWAKNNRAEKAKALGLSHEQVYTVASIVERETNNAAEKPTIAGVYLNRLKINMKLQADPTCVFATRDFLTHRVTQFHTTFDSPYNTYMYVGLPPGPISMASVASLDAVLNYEKHDYLYFCARPDDSGTHAFAATLPAHNVNAAKFRAWMAGR